MTQELEQVVMARVHRIHTLRHMCSATACKAYGLVLFAVGLLSSVSVASVYANMPSLTTPSALGKFYLNALLQTELLVKGLVLGIVVATVMLVLDVFHHTPRTTSPLAHA